MVKQEPECDLLERSVIKGESEPSPAPLPGPPIIPPPKLVITQKGFVKQKKPIEDIMSNVMKLYDAVIAEVINMSREFVLDEGVDEQTLSEIKQEWIRRLVDTKAVDTGIVAASTSSAAGSSKQNKKVISKQVTALANAAANASQANNGLLAPNVVQIDGLNDDGSSDEDDDDDNDRLNDDDNDDNEDEGNDEDGEPQPDDNGSPLNTDDDVSDDDPETLFETDNVIVCQYDKVTRSRNKWKFHLKDGIMNINGKDYIFQKCLGDAEW